MGCYDVDPRNEKSQRQVIDITNSSIEFMIFHASYRLETGFTGGGDISHLEN